MMPWCVTWGSGGGLPSWTRESSSSSARKADQIKRQGRGPRDHNDTLSHRSDRRQEVLRERTVLQIYLHGVFVPCCSRVREPRELQQLRAVALRAAWRLLGDGGEDLQHPCCLRPLHASTAKPDNNTSSS